MTVTTYDYQPKRTNGFNDPEKGAEYILKQAKYRTARLSTEIKMAYPTIRQINGPPIQYPRLCSLSDMYAVNAKVTRPQKYIGTVMRLAWTDV